MDLIVAATAGELGDLATRLPRRSVRTGVIGMGLVDAAANLARLLGRGGIQRVLFVGTAGALPHPTLQLGDLVVAGRASLYEEPAPGAYLPETLVQEVDASWILPDLPRVHVRNRIGVTSTVPPPTTTPVAESMEVFAVLRTAQLAGVPAGALLAISNHVGPEAHAQWLAHHQQVLAPLRTHLLSGTYLE